MQTKTYELPALYGDHHVLEVRRILLEIPGVKDVNASSAFHVVDVKYDEKKITDKEIQKKLEEAGYMGEHSIVSETGKAAGTEGANIVMRHTAVYEQLQQVVSFSQKIPYQGRPLWPCPGMGPLSSSETEE
jgi:copper chaperone CopZ